MLIKNRLIKISCCSVESVFGSDQNIHLMSSLPEMMRFDLTLTTCTLESMINYGFKEKGKKRTKNDNLYKLRLT